MLDRKFWPKNLTDEVLMRAASPGYYHDYPGFCLSCGHEQSGCEPDMRRGRCEACGDRQVYGAEELVINAM